MLFRSLFFMAEYANMIIASAVISSLFFGGWQIPFLSTEFLRANSSEALKIVLAFLAVGHLAAGLLMLKVGRKNVKVKKWGDRRDYEGLILGTGAIGAAFALVGALIFLWPMVLSGNASMIVTAVLQVACFLTKVLFFCWVFIWVRWTLPRFRYDQLMKLGWKYMMPVSLANIFITGSVMLIR